jgi:ribosomal protein S18 acetylase RimI-like enzyme
VRSRHHPKTDRHYRDGQSHDRGSFHHSFLTPQGFLNVAIDDIVLTPRYETSTVELTRSLRAHVYISCECQNMTMSGELQPSPTYRKVPFEWIAGRAIVERDQTADISWITSSDDERFVDVVARSLAASLDTSDRLSVKSMGATVAARTLLESANTWQVSRESDWWRLLCVRKEPAGFVLPVTYDVSVRAGEPEGTIFHMGIVPAFRGRGFGRLLLREAARVLLTGGVRRIFCDTDETNAPMIHLFETEGWGRLPIREVPLPLNFEPRRV